MSTPTPTPTPTETPTATCPPANLIHLYTLNNSLNDAFGGSNLVSNGGTITNNGYIFGRDQGLSLTGALPDIETYTIIVDVTFDTLSPNLWQKIIDFKNRASDNGLYVFKSVDGSHGLQLYPYSGVLGTVNKGVKARYVISRSKSGEVITYVDNFAQFVYNDLYTQNSVPDSNILLFCIDDLIVPGENDTGTIHRIEIYDGPLCAAILPTLPPTETPTTPTPTSTPTPTPTTNLCLYAWGKNDKGQLGDGTNVSKNVPTIIGSEFTKISKGENHDHYLAIKNNGDLYAWGSNIYGQLGDGTNVNKNVPTFIGSDYKNVIAGETHSLAIKNNGDLYAWGYNVDGELGDGTNVNKNVPTFIGSDYKNVIAGENHSLALKNNGDLYAWGSNYFEQLGDGTNVNKNVPTFIGSDYLDIGVGDGHSLAIKNNGDLYAWGANLYGQLGDGTNVNKNVPTFIGSGYKKVSYSGAHVLALKNNGDLYTWGYNNAGQLGDGTTVDKNVPTLIGSDYQNVMGGEFHSMALKNNGDLYTWGYNNVGQLGDGTTVDKNVPTLIGSGYLDIGSGDYTSYALKFCGGPTPTPTPTQTSTPCDVPCFIVKLIKAGEDKWIGVDTTGNLITFEFDEIYLTISDTAGVPYWNKVIKGWKNYIINGVLMLPGCEGIGVQGFCDANGCVRIVDVGFKEGGQDGAIRRYTWGIESGFTYSDGTPVVKPSWTINGNKFKVTFEKDANCSKFNQYAQTSICKIPYTVQEDTEVVINWEGAGETQDPCFDIMNVKINGSLVAYAHAPGGGKGCDGGDKEVISSSPKPYKAMLKSGDNLIELMATTKDPLYHSEAYYEFTVEPFSCCDDYCNLKILNVVEKETLQDGSKIYEVTVEQNDKNCCNIQYKLADGDWKPVPNQQLDCSKLQTENKIIVTMLKQFMNCGVGFQDVHFSGGIFYYKTLCGWLERPQIGNDHKKTCGLDADDYVSIGEYPSNAEAFPNATLTSFDSIAIFGGARLTIYEEKNFQGKVLLDVIGPAIVWNGSRANLNVPLPDEIKTCIEIMEEDWPDELNNIFPPNKRFKSNSNMINWGPSGSCKIIAVDANSETQLIVNS